MQLVKIEWSKHEWRGCMKHDQHLHNQWYILFFAYNEFTSLMIEQNQWKKNDMNFNLMEIDTHCSVTGRK